jgi:hypothetical protein
MDIIKVDDHSTKYLDLPLSSSCYDRQHFSQGTTVKDQGGFHTSIYQHTCIFTADNQVHSAFYQRHSVSCSWDTLYWVSYYCECSCQHKMLPPSTTKENENKKTVKIWNVLLQQTRVVGNIICFPLSFSLHLVLLNPLQPELNKNINN